MADNLTPEQRSRVMSRIRSTGTAPEIRLRAALWKRKLRGYRLQAKELPGCPDIVWRKNRVAVFVDGAFWHGHPKAFRKGKSGEYWDKKIRRNMDRDRAANAALKELGWTVLRFWDFEIKEDVESCVDAVGWALAPESSAESGREPT